MSWTCPKDWNLTHQECVCVEAIYDADGAARSATLLDKIRRGPVDPRLVKVVVCKARKKLARFNVHIETIWGVGYSIPEHEKDLLAQGRVTLPYSIEHAA